LAGACLQNPNTETGIPFKSLEIIRCVGIIEALRMCFRQDSGR
jgi:hypothetical protein